jgi:hypothetical protein
MALTYVGDLPIPLLCPQLQLCIGLPSIQFSADLTGALALNASLSLSPPTVSIYLAAEVEFALLLGLTVTNVPPLPTVNFDLSVSVSLEASFSLSLSLLLDFELGLSFSAFLSAHVALYVATYEGTANQLGASLATNWATQYPDGSPSSATCSAIVLGAASSVAMTILPEFLDGLTWGAGYTQQTIASLSAMLELVTKASTQAQVAIEAKAAAQAKVSAALRARGSISIPTPAITLSALATYNANLKAQLSLAPPKISAAISATANLAASIQASAGFMASFGALLRWDGGIFAYSYSGQGNQLGSALRSALSATWGDGTTPTNEPCVAVVLAATDSFSASVLAALFGGV